MSNDKINPLLSYLDDNLLDIAEFSRISKVPYKTIYPYIKGVKKGIQRKTACMVVKATKGKITLKELGHG